MKMEDGVIYYTISVPGTNESVRLTRDQVMHIPGLGFDGFLGYSVVSMARRSIGLSMGPGTIRIFILRTRNAPRSYCNASPDIIHAGI